MKKLFPRSTKCKRPTFKNVRGRTWDNCKIIDTEGNEHKGWIDTTWGWYFYFMDGNEWRKCATNHFNSIELLFDFRLVGCLDYKRGMKFVMDDQELQKKLDDGHAEKMRVFSLTNINRTDEPGGIS